MDIKAETGGRKGGGIYVYAEAPPIYLINQELTVFIRDKGFNIFIEGSSLHTHTSHENTLIHTYKHTHTSHENTQTRHMKTHTNVT